MARVANNLNICLHIDPIEMTDFTKIVQLDSLVQIGSTNRARHNHLLNWIHKGRGFHFDVLEKVEEREDEEAEETEARSPSTDPQARAQSQQETDKEENEGEREKHN